MHFKRYFSKLRLGLSSTVLEKIKLLQQWENLDYKQTATLQKKHLKEILVHSYHNVPYYKEELLKAGAVDILGKVNLEKFSKIPLLEKKTIRERFHDLKSKDLSMRRWYQNTSGGSTGEPVVFIQDSSYHDWSIATAILFDYWTGYFPSERKILLWGSVRDLFIGKETTKIKFLRWLKNEIWLNAFRMKAEQMRNYAIQINSYKPAQILAYAESIYELARFIEREGLQIYSPRAIMTSAGSLFPHMRETIERIFKTPVFNRYGCREVGAIACECERHKGLHIASPLQFVEVIRTDGTKATQGEAGELVITSLKNFAMPFIRYRIGDVGIWENKECDCGRGWQRLRKISGRTTNVFFTRDGGVVSPEYFIHLIGVELNTGWIRKFQVVQENYDHVRIKIVQHEKVTNPINFYAQAIENIEQKILLVMGNNCLVEFIFVDDIPPAESGKYLYTITKIRK